MTDDRSKSLVPQGPTSLSPISQLAERTLAERVEKALAVSARTLVVGPDGYATISAAVDAARDGDTILVRPGRYMESVVIEGKTITVQGDGEREAIMVGWDQGPAFTLVGTRSTLARLTIVGGSPRPKSNPRPEAASLWVKGGAPQLDELEVTRGGGIWYDSGATGTIEHSQIRDTNGGIYVCEGASPSIEANDISAQSLAAIVVRGAATDPLIRANRVHDGQSAGFFVIEGASPRIELNEIWACVGAGMLISGAHVAPMVTGNTVRDVRGDGIVVVDGASPTIAGNTITGNSGASIRVYEDANPMIGSNVTSV